MDDFGDPVANTLPPINNVRRDRPPRPVSLAKAVAQVIRDFEHHLNRRRQRGQVLEPMASDANLSETGCLGRSADRVGAVAGYAVESRNAAMLRKMPALLELCQRRFVTAR